MENPGSSPKPLKQTVLSWVVLCVFFGVLFVGTYKSFRGFGHAYLFLSDFLIYIGALILGISLLIYKGLGIFNFFSKSSLVPCFLAIALVQIASGFVHQRPTALQAITTDLAYGIWIVAAIALWWSQEMKHIIYFVMISLLLVFSYVLFKSLDWLSMHPPRELDIDLIFDYLLNAMKSATQRWPFYNPNFMAAFVGPLVVSVWASAVFSLVRVPHWFILLTFPMALICCISKAMMVLLFGSLVFLVVVESKEKIYKRFFLSYVILFLCGALIFSWKYFLVLFFLMFLIVFVMWLYQKNLKIIIFGVSLTVFLVFCYLFSINYFVNSYQNNPSVEKFVYESSSGIRLLMWDGVWKYIVEGDLLKESPIEQVDQVSRNFKSLSQQLLGFGPGFYVFVSSLMRHPSYYSGEYASDFTQHPHSSVFSFLADTGMIGFVIWGLLFFQYFNVAYRLSLLPGEKGRLAKVFLIVGVILACHSLVSAAAKYPAHRLHWVLLFSGLIFLELSHKRHSLTTQQWWPREFAGPFQAIIVGVILMMCFKGTGVLYERWSSLRQLNKAMSSFNASRKASISSGKMNDGKDISIKEFDAAMKRAEANILAKPGRDWVNLNCLKTLKLLALTRENYFSWAQVNDLEDVQLSSRWRKQVFVNLKQAIIWAPGFVDLARLYAEILWKTTENAKINKVEAFRLMGRDYSITEGRAESLAWAIYAIKKGSKDHHFFNSLLNHKTFSELREALMPYIEAHPIFHEAFRKRLLQGAKIRSSLVKAWINWHLTYTEKQELKSVYQVLQRYLSQQKEKSRYQLAHIFTINMLRRHRDVPLEVMACLKIGGASSPEVQKENLSIEPPGYGWCVEVLRVALFESPAKALELIDQASKQEKKDIYGNLRVLIERYLLKMQHLKRF